MRYTLTADERDLRSSLRTFLSNSIPRADYEAICRTETGFDEHLWKRLVDSGWLDLHAMSSESDGSAWPIAGVHMAEEFGRQLVPAPVELVAGFLFPLLRRLGPRPFGLELDDGSLAAELPAVHLGAVLSSVYGGTRSGAAEWLSAVQTDQGLTLSGRLSSVQFAASAHSLFLPVELGPSWALVRLGLDADGVSIEAHKTIDPGRTSATVTLSEVAVPTRDLVLVGADGGPVADLLAEAVLAYLLVLDGKAIGACDLLLERTISYVCEREQFGVPIGSFQAVKHKIAQMATLTESARSLAAYTAWQVAQRHDDRAEAVLSSRLCAADAFRQVCELAIQCHGGMGFTAEVGLQLWYQSAFFDAAVTGLTLADLARVLGSAA